MERLAVLSFIIGLLSVPIQAQAQQSLSMPGCIETLSSSRLASRERAHDVFISFKNKDSDGKSTRDAKMASDLYEFLTARDVRVFMSNASLEKLGTSNFKEAIDEALDAATVLIVVATSAENVKSKWMKHEWNSFFQDIDANVKPDGQVFTYLNGVSPKELPISLRQVQSFEEGDEGLAKLHHFIKNVLGE
jgi:TIR domain-containing protein